jgi:FkbM family methyltransferase
MNLLRLCASLTNRLAGKLFGVHLYAYQVKQAPSLTDALLRLQGSNIPFSSLIDVGASNGSWSEAFAAIFPNKKHLLVDANPIHVPALSHACARRSNWEFITIAVGGEDGTLYFDSRDPFGGHLSTTQLHERYHSCPVATIDTLARTRALPGPYLIKLDTHGVELPILLGAGETLKQTNALVIEAYNFTYGPPALPFWELCAKMLELGFRPLDLFDVLYREVDLALWQFDLVFVRSDLPLFQDSRFFISGRH